MADYKFEKPSRYEEGYEAATKALRDPSVKQTPQELYESAMEDESPDDFTQGWIRCLLDGGAVTPI